MPIKTLTRGLLSALMLAACATAAARPNIILVLTDDLDTRAFEDDAGLKALMSAQGTEFRDHFVSLSLCCPSRTSTLTGQFAHNTGIYTNQAPDGGFSKAHRSGLENSTIATWLHDGGYRTALIGKYLNGYPDKASPMFIPPGWDHWVSPVRGKPYSSYRYVLNIDGRPVRYGRAESGYITDVLSQRADQFVRDSVADHPDQPFFLYLSPYAPHSPARPPRRYRHAFDTAALPMSPAFNEADVSDKPAWVQANPLLTAAQIAGITDLYRNRRASMLAVGDLVRSLLDTLQATGTLDNTYVFFTSDNGFHFGEHRLDAGKDTPYEEDISVPLAVRGPGVPAGGTVNLLTANVDLAPTFAALAGLAVPASVDGRSLVPLLHGGAAPAWRKALLLEHAAVTLGAPTNDGTREPQDPYDRGSSESSRAPRYVGLRTDDGRTYVEYDTGERELYLLAADGAQNTNVFNAAAPTTKLKLALWVHSLRNASGSTLHRAEETPP